LEKFRIGARFFAGRVINVRNFLSSSVNAMNFALLVLDSHRSVYSSCRCFDYFLLYTFFEQNEVSEWSDQELCATFYT